MTRFVIHTTLLKLEHRRMALRARVVGGETIIDYEDLGWFAHFEGSRESIFLGMEKPDLTKGDSIKITIEAL